MIEDHRFSALMERLTAERTKLHDLRGDYATLTRSRFHALRMLWVSIKQLLGFASPRDVYAVWSPSIGRTSARFGAGEAEPIAEGGGELTRAERALIRSWSRRQAMHPTSDAPLVSIVIPVYNHRDVTVRCLQSLADTWFDSLAVQIVVVDDGSTDGTVDVLSRLVGVDCVRGRNEGFIRACNRGAALARGKYLCFLNNDTEVREGWLDHLVNLAESDDSIGVVGSKLIFPDGRLQEAGGIIWRDGTGWNYGRFERSEDPRYNFLRDADYVSGASLLIRAELFGRLGGFSEEYRPAYYEDTDLCFGVRALGYRVVYQPLSEVVHHDGLSSGDEASGTKRYQEINRLKFREKWATELQGHYENHHSNVFLGARRHRGEMILVVDEYVPLYDREAGSQRLLYVVDMLRAMHLTPVFLPNNYAGLQPYTRELQQMGIEVLHHIEEGGRTSQESLDSVLPYLSYAWISRPELFQTFEPLVRRNGATRIIYDTVDLHHVRERRKAELLGLDDAGWKEWQRVELDCCARADAVVVVTDEEREILESFGVRNVHVVSTVHELLIRQERAFEQSSGLLFIGNYNHVPNVDAVTWLCESVMPLVWKRLRDVTLTLVGNDPPDAVRALASRRVCVAGYVPDAGPYFSSSRIFVAPLRFGAGMKGKIGHALAYRLPVVTTPVGVEGLSLMSDETAVIAPPDPEAFADAIVRLYEDRSLWVRLSNASPSAIAPFTPASMRPRLERLIDSLRAHVAASS